MAAAAKTWLPKLAGLRRYLEQERAIFAAAPILLIQSQPLVVTTNVGTSTAATNSKKKNKIIKNESLAVSNACRHVQFLLSQQLGLRTVTVEHPTSYVFPTQVDVDRAMDLCRRVGAETVVGVGSRSAMDLAKAVSMQTQTAQSQSSHNPIETNPAASTSKRGSSMNEVSFRNLILVPATFGGVLAAAATSHSLLLDTAEEALTVYPTYQQQQQQQQSLITDVVTTTSVALEENMLDGSRRTDALLASIAISLQVLGRKQEGAGGDDNDDAQKALWVIQSAVACLNHESDGTKESSSLSSSSSSSSSDKHPPPTNGGPEQHDLAVRTVATAGTLISYGLQQHDRSLPLALAACLIPKHFSEHNSVTFMASLLPAMLEIYCGTTAGSTETSKNADNVLLSLEHDDRLMHQLRQHCHVSAPRIVTTEPIETLLASVHENQALWNCLDVSDKVLVRALEQHLLAP
jgi:hypothetical protein